MRQRQKQQRFLLDCGNVYEWADRIRQKIEDDYNLTRWYAPERTKLIRLASEPALAVDVAGPGLTDDQANEVTRLCRRLHIQWEVGWYYKGPRILIYSWRDEDDEIRGER